MLRIGMIGLGDIAQKVYLPLLSVEENWEFVGAFSPNEQKRIALCGRYRIKPYSSLKSLAKDIDAAFVHSSTETHFEVVAELLRAGIHVYVDKPLAATLDECEKLVELSNRHSAKLMVGFNRRFAPMYLEALNQIDNYAWIRIEKHRADRIHKVDYRTTLLDDYIHLVDLVRWVSDRKPALMNGTTSITTDNHLIFTNHTFKMESGQTVYAGMHRKAGSNLELFEIVGMGGIVRVKNLETLEREQNGRVIHTISPSWDTILKRRGFDAAVNHFIDSVLQGHEPLTNGEEALKSQQLLMRLIRETPILKQ